MEGKIITIKLSDTYSKTYKIRRVNTKERSMETTVPIDIVQRQASKEGVTVDVFLRDYKIEWRYNGFDGILLRFVKDENS